MNDYLNDSFTCARNIPVSKGIFKAADGNRTPTEHHILPVFTGIVTIPP